MNALLTLPDWVPWWAPILVLLPAALYALVFLSMPFGVIGVKSRLDAIEARLDELQNEIRHLALRLPAPAREADFEEVYAPRPVRPRPMPSHPTERRASERDRPPIPPAAYEPPEDQYGREPPMDDRPPPPPHARPVRRVEHAPAPPPPQRGGRAEPRLDWPR